MGSLGKLDFFILCLGQLEMSSYIFFTRVRTVCLGLGATYNVLISLFLMCRCSRNITPIFFDGF